ncbi:discoidin domain-containing receptor 2-like isoform X2 [Anthonomus grandis grandis]|nr:discoidin domain-containing receptor 2-like isoform X2 [Anthonomus grandis grandis]XP_050301156.1 discoidin domain-containing receptor 2-like isoform X2 [Anthonomus grandis grandis]
MESGKIRDFALTASTSYDSGSVGPKHGRLRNNRQGGAWCPRHMVSKNSREYLEIDLKELHVLTGIKTQGRYGNGQGQEYAEQYMVEYWRQGSEKWIRWKDRNGKELLSGNTDTLTIVEQTLDPPLICSKVRILPYSDHVRTVCMRVELTGCIFKDGLLSYSMPQGTKRTDIDLSDKTFDGIEENNQLKHGLGQLTDGVRGKDNFKLDLGGFGKGYEWIGWRNDTNGWAGLPLEILFEFDKIRNFSAAHLYTNNLFTKDVQVFSRARIFFSQNGNKFNPEPVHFSYMPDLVMEHSRNVTIKLHQRIGKFLKMQLYFASRWILLSEITFDSTVVSTNFSYDGATEFESTLPDFSSKEYAIQRDEVKSGVDKSDSARNAIQFQDSLPRGNRGPSQQEEHTSYIGFIIGMLMVTILILAASIALIILRNHRNRVSLSDLPETANDGDEKVTIDAENKEIYSNNASSYYSQQVIVKCPNYTDLDPNSFLNFHGIDSQFDSYNKEPPPVPPPPDDYYSGREISEIFSNDLSISSEISNRPSTRPHLILPLSLNEMPDNGRQKDKTQEDFQLTKFSSEKLQIIEKMGKGRFGDLHICEIRDDFIRDSSAVNFGIVMSLDNVALLEEFRIEAQFLLKLQDPNQAKILGGSLDNPPYYIIREYSQYGDLCQYLQDHVAESASALSSNASVLSYGCLIYMASQVASAMKYFEANGYVHKDLAARNCLVGKNYEVKVTDLGNQREIYSQDYCQISGPSFLPLRWMAWESALLGSFSIKSDIWAFAVVLWEILTFAREQPFEYLTDDKVLENLAQYYQNSGNQIFLDIPHNCPKEIYDLMLECWNRNESDRPTFREIHLFLQRKNLGYKPEMH